MRAVRLGAGASLAVTLFTLYVGACSSGGATPCGGGGVVNGTCQAGARCPAGSDEISVTDPFDALACPSSTELGGAQYVCCSTPADGGVAPPDGASGTDARTPTMDATTGPDARHPGDAGVDVTVPAGDSGQVDSGQVDSGQVDSGQADSGPVDSGQLDSREPESGPVDGAHPDAGADAPSDSGHGDAAHDGGEDSAQPSLNGQACTTGGECESGKCVGGVCCDTACTGTCQACTAALTGVASGTCASMTAGASAPVGQCAASPPCGNDGKCAAGGACEQVTVGTACGTAACANAAETVAAACDGAGNCATSASVACPGGFVCQDAATCKTACASNSDCAAMTAVCVSPGPTGTCALPTCSDGIQDDQETGVDCGGPTCGMCATVLVVAAGSGGTYGGELHPTTSSYGSWSTAALGDSSTDPPSLAFLGSGASSQGVGVMHSAAGADLLEYATWVPGATSIVGAWTSFASVGAGITTRKGPAIAPAGTSSLVTAFHGTDFNHYFTSFDGSAWATVEEVTSGGTVATGPTPAGIAALGSNDAIISYFLNAANTPEAQERVTTWAPAVSLSTDESFVARPSIVAMNGGVAELMVAYIRQSDGAVLYATRAAGIWSTTQPIPGASAHVDGAFGPVEYVGLAAISGGGAALAYRDAATGGIFDSLYSGGTWSAPAAFMTPNATPVAAPALAPGVAGATVEMAFVDSDTTAYHTRLVAGAWTTPVAIGGSSLASVAIAAGP